MTWFSQFSSCWCILGWARAEHARASHWARSACSLHDRVDLISLPLLICYYCLLQGTLARMRAATMILEHHHSLFLFLFFFSFVSYFSFSWASLVPFFSCRMWSTLEHGTNTSREVPTTSLPCAQESLSNFYPILFALNLFFHACICTLRTVYSLSVILGFTFVFIVMRHDLGWSMILFCGISKSRAILVC